jgi:hypothetical protein
MLSIDNQEFDNSLVKLYSISGQLLISKTKLPQNCFISVQNLASGIYIVDMASENEDFKLKIKL